MGDDDGGIKFAFEKNRQLQCGEHIVEEAQWLRIKAKSE